MSVKEVSAKFNSKVEFHYFLTHEMNAFLPSPDRLTIYHLRDLMSGKKQVSTITTNTITAITNITADNPHATDQHRLGFPRISPDYFSSYRS